MIPEYKKGKVKSYLFWEKELLNFFAKVRENKEFKNKTDKELSELFRFNISFSF